jgi:hypothetical protein
VRGIGVFGDCHCRLRRVLVVARVHKVELAFAFVVGVLEPHAVGHVSS